MTLYSHAAALSWQVAAIEARAGGFEHIEKEHVAIGVCSLAKVLSLKDMDIDPAIRSAIKSEHEAIESSLARYGLDTIRFRRMIRTGMGPGNYIPDGSTIVHRSGECKRAFAVAEKLAGTESAVTTMHLLAAVLESPGIVIPSAAPDLVAYMGQLRSRLLACVAELKAGLWLDSKDGRPPGSFYLDRYGVDMTRRAKAERMGLLSGRKTELEQIEQILCRRFKNNPLLVGPAGVGKTSLARMLAQRIADGQVPPSLAKKRVIELSTSALVGGTRYRGDLEGRVAGVLQEAREAGDIILFIDELHDLVGAGRSEGSTMDMADMMKSALDSGEVLCMGATTDKEYRSLMQRDPAFERRFDIVLVNEPGREEAVEILNRLRPEIASHYGVAIEFDAVCAAVDLSIRLDRDHCLPDKAIDLLDRASGRAASRGTETVSRADVAGALADRIHIPVQAIASGGPEGDATWLRGLEPFLKSHIAGQDEAISLICQRLNIAFARLGARKGPLGVLLLSGPAGVGKTETACRIAEYLYGSDPAALIKIDMAEYTEDHSVARLAGSPPGYAGYREEGPLESIRTRPYAIVLLENADMASPRVLDLFLQLFDTGILVDASGRTIDARQALFLLTIRSQDVPFYGFTYEDLEMNGASVAVPGRHPHQPGNDNPAGRDDARSASRNNNCKTLMERSDEIIRFRPLDARASQQIMERMLREIVDAAQKEYGLKITIDQEVVDWLAQMGVSANDGTRGLLRVVDKYVRAPVSSGIVAGSLQKARAWKIVMADDGPVMLSG